MRPAVSTTPTAYTVSAALSLWTFAACGSEDKLAYVYDLRRSSSAGVCSSAQGRCGSQATRIRCRRCISIDTHSLRRSERTERCFSFVTADAVGPSTQPASSNEGTCLCEDRVVQLWCYMIQLGQSTQIVAACCCGTRYRSRSSTIGEVGLSRCRTMKGVYWNHNWWHLTKLWQYSGSTYVLLLSFWSSN